MGKLKTTYISPVNKKYAHKMDNKVSINNNSVDSAGITKDYMEAVSELLWNGFDANATEVDIIFDTNQIGTIHWLSIIDNGTGINLGNLSETFGAFLDSIKRNTFQRSSYTKGKKGKGRFSFIAFANEAKWQTTFLDQATSKYCTYDISISASNKDVYKNDNQTSSESGKTGTKLTLTNLHSVTGYSFQATDFVNYLKNEFGWFLLLNKKNEYKLCINGEQINYEDTVAESEEISMDIKDVDGTEHHFDITYIRWNEKIGDKYYYYFLNDEKREISKSLTSFNNNAINFYHSLYIESSFFNNFIHSESAEPATRMFGTNNATHVYKVLYKELQKIVAEKQKLFIRGNAADELISRYERTGAIPKFGDSKYEQEKKKDLIGVVKEIYCIQPKIFKGLTDTQERTSIGFINLLLDTNERENILTILDGIVNISAEERKSLATLLQKTTFGRITRTINLIESRYRTVELLKALVFDLKIFTNERDHIQHAIAENYWLFGEQFHLVSANVGFEKLLASYLNILDGEEANKVIQNLDPEKNRRPDIFICRQRSIPDNYNHDDDIEENIMVELKRPTVVIGKEQLRQIEDYMDYIIRNDQFNSSTRKWKFFVVSNKIDDYIQKQYEAFQDKGKRYLVKSSGNMEIYAMSWDDVFRTFTTKHKYLLNRLELDQKSIREEMKSKGISFDIASSDEITRIVKVTAADNKLN